MKLLVTGGAGFIGSNFVRYWLRQHPEDSIMNLDALTYAGHRETIADLEADPRHTFVAGDICDEALVRDLVATCDLVVHFAAETHVDRSIKSSREFVRTNVEGTRTLLDAVLVSANRPRFHHVSTDEVFGALKPGDPAFTERTPYDPRSPYSASKAASDHLVRAYFHTHGLPVTISNCSNNYGPYQLPEKLIPLFITNLIQGKKIGVYGQGLQVRDWLHVDDHARGIEAIIERGALGETYCLGGGNELTNIEITKRILAGMAADESMIEYVADRPGHDFRYAIDFSRASAELGWKPEIGFEDGLRETIAWYKDHEPWWRAVALTS